MKRNALLKSVLSISLLGSLAAVAGTPIKAPVPVDGIFSPKGFDSNDNTEVVLSGYLPNLCHRAPTTEVKVVGKKIEIEVTALKYQDSNPFCPPMTVPFLTSVNVGVLDKGDYDIVINPKTPFQDKGSISIAESTSDAVDDYVYANVEYVEKFTDSREIRLKGHNPSDCFVLEKIEFISNGKDTYSVLPVMKQVSDFCPMKMVPFEYAANVPEEIKAKKVLLHVRVMDGRSVNSLFYSQQDSE